MNKEDIIDKIEQEDIEIYYDTEDNKKYLRYTGKVFLSNGSIKRFIIPKVSLNWENITFNNKTINCMHNGIKIYGITIRHQCYLDSNKLFLYMEKENDKEKYDNEENRLTALLERMI
jgi:hypothetical protein